MGTTARRMILFGSLATLGTCVDLITKEWVFAWKGLPSEQSPWWLVPEIAGIETAVNQGAVFGLGQGYGFLFASVSILAILGLMYWLFIQGASRSIWLTTTLGIVTGGILGNLYDRLNLHGLPGPYAGGVRDWILLKYQDYVWPNFNIADSLLVTGAIMLGIYSVFFAEPKPQTQQTDPATSP